MGKKPNVKENPISGSIAMFLIIIGIIPVLLGVAIGSPFFLLAYLIMSVFSSFEEIEEETDEQNKET